MRQTYGDWEYLIVDDESTDTTAAIVEEFERRDNRIRLIRRESSGGPYIAANEGIRQARGKYIVRTDADDHFPPERIARQVGFLESHPEHRACVSYWQAFTDAGIRPHIVVAPRNSRVFRWELLLRAPSLHSAVCYEKSTIEELGGYPELPLSQDYWLWCQLTRHNWLGTIPEVLCYVRYHEGRQTHTNSGLQIKLGLEVLGDHMLALTGERWSLSDLTALRAVGLGSPTGRSRIGVVGPLGSALEGCHRPDGRRPGRSSTLAVGVSSLEAFARKRAVRACGGDGRIAEIVHRSRTFPVAGFIGGTVKICFICNEYPPGPHGGIGTMTQLLAKRLVSKGHEVRSVGIYPANYPAPPTENDHGVEVVRIPERQTAFGWITSRYAVYRQVQRWVRAGQADVVEVPDYQGMAAFWPKLSVPVIARLHGSLRILPRSFASQSTRAPTGWSAAHSGGRTLFPLFANTPRGLPNGFSTYVWRKPRIIYNPVETRIETKALETRGA